MFNTFIDRYTNNKKFSLNNNTYFIKEAALLYKYVFEYVDIIIIIILASLNLVIRTIYKPK